MECFILQIRMIKLRKNFEKYHDTVDCALFQNSGLMLPRSWSMLKSSHLVVKIMSKIDFSKTSSPKSIQIYKAFHMPCRYPSVLVFTNSFTSNSLIFHFFYNPSIEDSGSYGFWSVCMCLCLSPKTLTLDITFEW